LKSSEEFTSFKALQQWAVPPSLRSSRWSTWVSLAKKERQGFNFQECWLQKEEEN